MLGFYILWRTKITMNGIHRLSPTLRTHHYSTNYTCKTEHSINIELKKHITTERFNYESHLSSNVCFFASELSNFYL